MQTKQERIPVFHRGYYARSERLKPFYYPAFPSVRIQFNLDLVADKDFDAVHAHAPRKIGQNLLSPFKGYPEESIRQCLVHDTYACQGFFALFHSGWTMLQPTKKTSGCQTI